jgi:hypothetical protein
MSRPPGRVISSEVRSVSRGTGCAGCMFKRPRRMRSRGLFTEGTRPLGVRRSNGNGPSPSNRSEPSVRRTARSKCPSLKKVDDRCTDVSREGGGVEPWRTTFPLRRRRRGPHVPRRGPCRDHRPDPTRPDPTDRRDAFHVKQGLSSQPRCFT